MSILLYRKGDTHKIQGTLCEVKKIDSKHFKGKPEDGWYLTIKSMLEAEPSPPMAAEAVDQMFREEVTIEAANVGGLPTILGPSSSAKFEEESKRIGEVPVPDITDAKEQKKAIRQAAKDAGLKNWQRGPIVKLQEALARL